MSQPRALPWDWHPGTIPDNVVLDETAYLETTYSFRSYRSRLPVGLRMGRGASAYMGVMFDLGERGQVTIGDYALVNGGRLICDSAIEIGDYALISWNVVLMDSYRLSDEPMRRRPELEALAQGWPRPMQGPAQPRAIRIGRNVWIGFDACVLPGVSIGEGAIVGARSVVVEDVEAFTVVAGNPARMIRRLESAGA